MRTALAVAALALCGCGGLKLKPDPTLAACSLSWTRVERVVDNPAGKTVTAYVVFDKPFDGTLELRLFDRDDAKGVEVGRSVLRVHQPAGARYVDFLYDARTPVFTSTAAQLKAVPDAAPPAPAPVEGPPATDGGTAP